MQLHLAVKNILAQLTGVIGQLKPDEYNAPCLHLSGNTIGQHVRHVIELFHCLEEGSVTGVVNYEIRKRDRRTETDIDFAVSLLSKIPAGLLKENKQLVLEATYEVLPAENLHLQTNYYREIAYNLEHTIHHMALIRVGIHEIGCLCLEENFGVAASTIKYKQQCAQ
jgi:hypothetical protein